MLLFAFEGSSQNEVFNSTVKVWRINFLNPAIELELPVGNKSTLSTGIGVGYGGSYPHLTNSIGTGFVLLITPFIDLQYKFFYNFDKRLRKGKTIKHNSGNYVSARFLARGKSLESNISRTSESDFAFGPTWGIQRSKGQFHFLFDMGPIFYFDGIGNQGIFPIFLQVNLGIDL